MKIFLVIFIVLSSNLAIAAWWPFKSKTISMQCLELMSGSGSIVSLGYGKTRARSLSVNIGARVQHDDFAEGMWIGVQSAARLVKRKGPSTDLFEVLQILADRRRKIAEESKDPEAPNYGTLRRVTDDAEWEKIGRTRTPSNNRYDQSILLGQKFAIEAGEWPAASKARIGLRWVEVTTVFWDKAGKTLRYFIMGSKDAYIVLEHVRKIFADSLKIKNDPEKVIRETARIHWWLATAMPYARGSAAIADALTKVIFVHHGISAGEWAKGITPDVVAFMVSEKTFVEIYPQLFAPQ